MEFSFYIIDKVKKEDCFEKEKQWMNILRSNDPKTGYNLSKQEAPITDLPKFQRFYLECIRGTLTDIFE